MFYVGLTNDLRKRLDEHNSGRVLSAIDRIPFKLIYYEACLTRKDATIREKYLKTTWGEEVYKKSLALLSHGVNLV